MLSAGQADRCGRPNAIILASLTRRRSLNEEFVLVKRHDAAHLQQANLTMIAAALMEQI